MAEVDDVHYLQISDFFMSGEVVPFLGAGANMCDRPDDTPWESGQFLPSGAELAAALAKESRYPATDTWDLLRVSQYVDAVLGERQLYRYLRKIFDVDYPTTSLHAFLARLPAVARENRAPQPLVITTNYDDLVERALRERDEPYDVVWYEAKGSLGGKFMHRPPDGTAVPIDVPDKYDAGLSLAEQPVILKLHGAIDRDDPKGNGDSFVITEDNYIDYLAQGDVGSQIPVTLRERMGDSHFLFLGYSMRDWNLRVILNRIWGAQELDLKSWAIQREPEDPTTKKIEERLWAARGDVEPLYVELREYIARLSDELFGAAVEQGA